MKQQRDAEHALSGGRGWRVLNRKTADALEIPWKRPPWLMGQYVAAVIEDVWIRQDIGEWRAMLRIVPSKNGNPVVAEVRVFPQEADVTTLAVQLAPEEWTGCYLGRQARVPGGGLTARTLGAVRIGEAIRKGTADLRRRLDRNPHGAWSKFWPTRPARRPRRGGRQPVTDDQLVSIAYVYCYANREAHPAPVQFTAKHHHITQARARDWLHTARERDILKKADSTRPVGELTEKGEQLWKDYQARKAVQEKGGRGR